MSIQKITCKQATTYLTQQEEKRLPLNQRLELMLHLAGCSLCRLFSRQSKWINQALGNTGQTPETKLADAEKEAIIAAMANKDEE